MDYRSISKLTQKGSALHKLAENTARSKAARLAIGADATTNQFSVNGQAYELLSVATGLGQNTANGEWNNTDPGPLTVTITGHGRSAGEILRVGSEFFRVDRVINANSVVLSRAQFGSAAVAHANGQAIFRTATQPVAGTKTIPVSAIGTAATLAANIKAAFDWHDDNKVITEVVGTNVFFISQDEMFDLTVSNGTLAGSSFSVIDGVPKGAANGGVYIHTITAGEATAGFAYVVLAFEPTDVVLSYQRPTGAVAADTSVTINGRVVRFNEGSAPAWTAGDKIGFIAV